MSEIAKVIDAVITGGLAPAAKAAGFTKGGRNFWRTDGDAVLVTNVQASRSNDANLGTFTINLGVWFPAVGARADLPVPDPKRPSEPSCPIRTRLGAVMPGGADRWWTVTATTNVADVAREVATAWQTFGLAWLEANRDLGIVADRLAAAGPSFLAIQFRVAQGRLDDARQLLARLQNDASVFPGHRDHVTAWAVKHGLA